MNDPRAIADLLTWSLARQVRPGDVLVIGVATPLAAAAGMLARELLAPDLTIIAAGSVDPATHDVAETLIDPTAVARRAAGTLTQAEILDAIQRGRVTLQFISPAEVDGLGRVNTNRIRARDGSVRRLPGALALPDVSVLVGRLVAYRAGHSSRFLVPRVHFVTGAGQELERSAPELGAGVGAIITEVAEIEVPGGGATPRLTAVQPGASVHAAKAGCGFALEHDAEVNVAEPMPPEARALLDDLIDPHEVRLLEVRTGRDAALARIEALARERRDSA